MQQDEASGGELLAVHRLLRVASGLAGGVRAARDTLVDIGGQGQGVGGKPCRGGNLFQAQFAAAAGAAHRGQRFEERRRHY